MKARREARLKRELLVTPEKVLPASSPASSKAPGSMSSPTRASFSPSHFHHDVTRKTSTSTSSDVDFSPATGSLEPTTLHPVPCSVDNGRTFDWSCVYSDDGDRKWTISIGKRKDKDKLPPLATMMDEQEQLHKG